ncbi:DNA-binding HxlR family transcriptional regulator [Paenibacillus shirakamiensis]|uniref:DNA-binding HxlR family transcriptional regulator n=1 Tax=Paenibacillus shirakamiensis TaxID=1265935 RepID=A0ABS4JIY7_9BACL|nr:helix-turn-helix domain-containing protein [Paenibacillus shirakamiensis]MBP2001663.1 DNA-binding HxlR family transcriptional regulator [Paenibacillus shirakamiensis]
MIQYNENTFKQGEKGYLILGKKWTGLIIFALIDGPRRFNEVHTLIPVLSKRVLNERMKELEATGIVIRNVITERPTRIEYSLTTMGRELTVALKPVEQWSQKWL